MAAPFDLPVPELSIKKFQYRISARLASDVLVVRDGKISYALSPREWEVLNLREDGLTNPQIANRLGLKTSTVRVTLYKARQRLGLRVRKRKAETTSKPVGALQQA